VSGVVLRQILSALKNSEIPYRDGCPIQVIPFALERQESLPEQPRAVYLYILRMEEPGRFCDATWFGLGSPIVPVVQPSQSHMRKDVT
jgi:hypothetical protein